LCCWFVVNAHAFALLSVVIVTLLMRAWVDAILASYIIILQLSIKCKVLLHRIYKTIYCRYYYYYLLLLYKTMCEVHVY